MPREQSGFAAVVFMQPGEFPDNLRHFGIHGTAIFHIDQYSPLQSIKKSEHISDIGVWTTTPVGEPAQVSAALQGQGIRITRPVEIHWSRIVAAKIDALAWVNQCRISPTIISWQAMSNINHPARNYQTANFDAFMARYPLSGRAMQRRRRWNAVAGCISQ